MPLLNRSTKMSHMPVSGLRKRSRWTAAKMRNGMPSSCTDSAAAWTEGRERTERATIGILSSKNFNPFPLVQS